MLEFFGWSVEVPRAQTCCGQAHFNAGATGEARALVERMGTIFSSDRPVVTPSGSCAAMVIEHAPTISDDPAVHSLAKRTREITQFLFGLIRLSQMKEQDHEVLLSSLDQIGSCSAAGLMTQVVPHESVAKILLLFGGTSVDLPSPGQLIAQKRRRVSR